MKLGTYVIQAGVRDPIQVAVDAATLDALAPGRVLLGVGAGHTFREWEATGRPRPSANARAGRLVEFVDAVVQLLDGDTVNVEGRYLRLVDAHLDDLPVGNHRVRIVVGGGHPEVLAVGSAKADVVALSGLGRTLPDGHRHQARWSQTDLDSQLRVVHEAAVKAGRSPEVEVLVQVVTVSDDRSAVLAEVERRIPMPRSPTSALRRTFSSAPKTRWLLS